MAHRYDHDREHNRDREPYSHRDEEHRRERRPPRDDERWRSQQDRGVVDRASDEVRSWFGDEEAARRRQRDEERDYRDEHRRRDYGGERSFEGQEHGRDPGMNSGRGSWRGATYPGGSGRERGYAAGEDARRGSPQGGDEAGWSGRSSYDDSDRSDWGSRQGSWRSESFNRAGDAREPERGRDQSWDRGEDSALVDYPYSIASWMVPGPYVGRGPRGYSRSDDRIREDVCDRLTRHGRIDATEMDVTVRNGEVTLQGLVDSRQAKRLAEDVAESVDGVRDVDNRLRLHRGGSSSDVSNRMTGAASGGIATGGRESSGAPAAETSGTTNKQS